MRNRRSTRPPAAISGREVTNVLRMGLGSTDHGVCLLDDDGMPIRTWMVKHTDTELAALFAELAQLGDPALAPVAIEDRRVAGLHRGSGRRGRRCRR